MALRSRQKNTVTLMPFLAVLLCTMGALIMLLIVVAKDVQDAAVSQVTIPDSLAAETAQLQQSLDEIDWLAEEYRKSHSTLQEEVAARRARLAFLEDQTRRRLDEAAILLRTQNELKRGRTTNLENAQAAQRSLDLKQKEVAAAMRELQNLRSASAKRSYSITPAMNKNGTRRRPMFIECRDNSVILQPEGIVLTEADFITAGRPDAPLDVALRSQQQYFAECGANDAPYPLVVVRPSGASLFPAVRASLGSWVSDFGYELVDEDWKIQYPQANPEIKSRVESQIVGARQRVMMYVSQQRDEMQNRQTGGTYRVGRGGVVERVDASPKIASRESYFAGEKSSSSATSSATQTQNTGETFSRASNAANSAESEENYSADQSENQSENTAENNSREHGFGLGKTQKTSTPQEFPDLAPHQLYSDSQIGENARNAYNAQQAKENWGLRDAESTARGVTRSVRVICGSDFIELPQQSGLLRPHRIDTTINAPAATQEFVVQLWEFMESWGIAGANMYWKPVLKVTVAPGAESAFEQFQKQLDRSGFVIERDTNRK